MHRRFTGPLLCGLVLAAAVRVRGIADVINVSGRLVDAGEKAASKIEIPPREQEDEKTPGFHAFYHVYAATTVLERSIYVMQEQLATMEMWGMADKLDHIHITVVGPFYETLWEKFRTTTHKDSKYTLNENISGPSGDEAVTLQYLWQHCKSHPLDIVAYFHSKGLYHAHVLNEYLRQHLMHGISVPCCLDSLLHGGYNVCGMRFCPQPYFHFPGNMWLARCDYINLLLPPIDYETKMESVFSEGILGDVYRNETTLFWWGLGRYSSEHWVGAHPSLRAVDSMPHQGYQQQFYCAAEDPLPGYHIWGELPLFHPNWRKQANVVACEEAPRHGLHGIPIASNYFIQNLSPEIKMVEYQKLYGGAEESPASAKGKRQTTACLYYQRIYRMLQEHGHDILPGSDSGQTWVRGWERSLAMNITISCHQEDFLLDQ